MKFELDWASRWNSRPMNQDELVQKVIGAGFMVGVDGKVEIQQDYRGNQWPRDMRHWFVEVSSLDELKELYNVTGKDALIIEWPESEGVCNPKITVYDSCIE